MKVLFMGTSEFAVPILNALSQSQHTIIQVFTAPPAKANRGHKLQQSPVHLEADQLGILVSCPKSLSIPETLDEIKGLKPDAIVVASYGKILPTSVLSICHYGCINVHPSALPRWRGAAPIERTILAGDETTEVCIMKMDEGIDTGGILLSEEFQVPNKVTAPELRDKLAIKGGELLIKVLDNIDSLKPQKQSEKGITYAKKLEKQEGLISWKDSAFVIERMVRAFYSWPGCFFEYKGELIRLLEAEAITSQEPSIPGKVLDNDLSISCGEGILRPKLLKRSGRKAMPVKDFLNGFSIKQGTLLQS